MIDAILTVFLYALVVVLLVVEKVLLDLMGWWALIPFTPLVGTQAVLLAMTVNLWRQRA